MKLDQLSRGNEIQAEIDMLRSHLEKLKKQPDIEQIEILVTFGFGDPIVLMSEHLPVTETAFLKHYVEKVVNEIRKLEAEFDAL